MGTLVFIGLGLHDEKDVSLRGLEYIKSSDLVFMENYTSRLLGTNLLKLQEFFGRDIEILDREGVEQSGRLLGTAAAPGTTVAFLVVGDTMTATTHSSLFIEARQKGIKTVIVPGASIYSVAPGLAGLQHYKFGRTTTLVEPEGDYFPKSPYHIIKENIEAGCHTLVLLDIRVEGQDEGGKASEPFLMPPGRAISLLKRMEQEEQGEIILPGQRVVIIGNAGSPEPVVVSASFCDFDEQGLPIEGPENSQDLFPTGIYCLIIPGNLHFLEEEMLEFWGLEPGKE